MTFSKLRNKFKLSTWLQYYHHKFLVPIKNSCKWATWFTSNAVQIPDTCKKYAGTTIMHGTTFTLQLLSVCVSSSPWRSLYTNMTCTTKEWKAMTHILQSSSLSAAYWGTVKEVKSSLCLTKYHAMKEYPLFTKVLSHEDVLEELGYSSKHP
jgi:hypothetical protein